MDEPLSNLDAKLRVQTRAEIAKLQHDLGVTTIYVTHDQVEAMTMGDRVAVMTKGELQQVDDAAGALRPAASTCSSPAFIGSPSMNLLEATLEQSGEQLRVRRSARSRSRSTTRLSTRMPRSRPTWDARSSSASAPRTWRTRRSRRTSPADRRLKGKVELTEALGSEIMVHFTIDAAHAVTEDVHELQADIGDRSRARRGVGVRQRRRRDRGPLRPALARQGRRHDRGRRRHALAALLRSRDRLSGSTT